MMKLLAFLWTGCWHQWEPVSKHILYGDAGGKGMRFMYQCKKCGKVKSQDII